MTTRLTTHLSRTFLALGAALALAAPAPVALSAPSSAPAPDDQRVEGWRKDLAYLTTELHRVHPALTPSSPMREPFDAAARELDQRLPSMADREVPFAFARLAATLGDLHTTVDPMSGTAKMRGLPIVFWWFPDGLHAVILPGERKELLGQRLVRVAGVPADEAIAKIRPICSVENVWSERRQAPRWISCIEALQACGVTDADADRFEFVLADADGKETTLTLAPITPGERPSLVGATDPGTPARDALLYSNPRSAYWARWLPGEGDVPGALYLQYNRCADDPLVPFAKVAAEGLKAIDDRSPRAVVIDLRNNSGGDSRIINPLLEGLAERKEKLAGRLTVLVSRHTMSSGLMNAVQLRDRCAARIIGEPPSQRVNHWGEMKSFTLPVSGLKAHYSTKRFRMEEKDADQMALDAEIVTPWADFIVGKDPALEAALSPHAR